MENLLLSVPNEDKKTHGDWISLLSTTQVKEEHEGLLPLEAVTRLCSRILTLNRPLKCLDF